MSPAEQGIDKAWREVESSRLVELARLLRNASPYMCCFCDFEFTVMPERKKCAMCKRVSVKPKRQLLIMCIRSLHNNYHIIYSEQRELAHEKFMEHCKHAEIDPYDYLGISK
jgi:hypothetical protein